MASSHSLTRQKLIEIAGTLPPAPRVFAELNGLLRNVNTDIDRITELLKKDPSLAAQVLRVSNSVVFRSQQRAGSVEDAVGRIGFQEVYRVVGLAAAQRLAERALLHYEVSAERLRDHMVETAFVCEVLAPECRLDARTAYTAGLMRPIGMLVLDRVADILKIEQPYDHASDGTYLSWEGRNFGMGNSEVAGLILSDWAFPNEIVSAIRDQYLNFENATENKMACLMNLACSVVASDGRAMEGEAKFWDVTDEKLRALGLSAAAFSQASKRALKAYGTYRRGADTDTEKANVPPPVQSALLVESRPSEPALVRVVAPVERPVEAPVEVETEPLGSFWHRVFVEWPLPARLFFLVVSGVATGALAAGCRFFFAGGSASGAAELPEQAARSTLDAIAIGLADFVQAITVAVQDVRTLGLCGAVLLLYVCAMRLEAAAARSPARPGAHRET